MLRELFGLNCNRDREIIEVLNKLDNKVSLFEKLTAELYIESEIVEKTKVFLNKTDKIMKKLNY